MAELTAMRNNVLGYPIYALPYVVVFPILDEDGDIVTGLTPDSEISKNGDTAVDTATEAAEIAFDTATNKGMYQLQLSAAEMTCDVAAITVYTGATAAQATALVLYPKKLPKIIAGATAGATGNDASHIHIPDGVAINDFYNGCVIYLLTNTGALQARMISDYVASTKLATVSPAFATAPDNTTTYDIYMTEVAVASILALLTGAIPNAVAGAAGGNAIVGSVMGKSPATLAAGDVTGNLPAEVKAQDNIDFGALQKASLNAATPASVQNIPATGSGFTALGDTRLANLDAAVSTRALESGGSVAAIKAKTDNLPAAPAAVGSAMTLTSAYDAAKNAAPESGGNVAAILEDTAVIGALGAGLTAITSKTNLIPASPAAVGSAMTLADDAITSAKFDETTAFPLKSADTGASQIARVGADGDTLETLSDQIDAITPVSAADIADAVWDEAIDGHADAGSTGAYLGAAGIAGDPWLTPLPGAYAEGTAGQIIGDNLDSPISEMEIAATQIFQGFEVSVDTDLLTVSLDGIASKLVLKQGEAKTLTFTVTDADGAVVDISAATLTLGVKAAKTDTAYALTKADVDFGKAQAANGIVTVAVDEDDTNLTEGTYLGELMMSWGGGTTIEKTADFYIQIRGAVIPVPTTP